MASDPDRASPTSSAGGGGSGAVQKHRACDECRSRKLACSKEPEGCSRCRREGIRCHYSPQKPMGRPRKRRNLDDEEASEPARTSPPLRQQKRDRQQKQQQRLGDQLARGDSQQLPFGEGILSHPIPSTASNSDFGVYDASALMPLDPGLAFLNDQRHDGAAGIDFLDMLPPQDYATTASAPHHHHHHQHPQTGSPPDLSSTSLAHTSPSFNLDLSGVDLLGGIGFEQSSSAPRSAAARVMHSSFDHYMDKNWDQNASTDPSLSGSNGNHSVHSGSTSSRSSHSSIRANPNITCGCLSSLYLTLDCLSNIPTDIPAAIRTVRNSIRVAHATIRCNLCSGPEIMNSATEAVPIQAFQNLMLLAALVPSACNAYATILERVDVEADRARGDAEGLWFSFRDFGGPVWDAQAQDGKACMLMQGFNDKKMPPDMWRAAVREIIRADVEGGEVNGYGDQQLPNRGLRDVIRALEERSHKRHAHLDHAAATGTLPKGSMVLHPRQDNYRPVPPEDRHCMRVLDAARMALNNLVIA